MTREEAKELLTKVPIITAFAEGKTVQLLYGGDWRDCYNPDFSELAHNYRVKPAPMELWVVRMKAGMEFFTDERAAKGFANGVESKAIHFREVVEDAADGLR